MRIAAVTVIANEWHQLDEWQSHYDLYKSAIDAHIIVDNNSENKFHNELQKRFGNSIILKRTVNGGITAAFNDGIRKAIELRVDVIILICPDIQISGDVIRTMADYIMSQSDVGVVGPILLKRDSEIIECVGGTISAEFRPVYNHLDTPLNQFQETNTKKSLPVEFIPGGINMSRPDVYGKVGLQDEELFMYGDEIDWDIRVKNSGLKLEILTGITASHQHIFTSSKNRYRSDLAYFLMARNTILLAHKYSLHKGALLKVAAKEFANSLKPIGGMILRKRPKKALAIMRGIFKGLVKDYKIPISILPPTKR
ncbi:glycosyltransferase family 2 protein [Niabella sp. CJ426]|uniref:glycosyltransferase family 2 protein n=1 Tax=Niabella sp. CJ426 TaxID=3393740 RepID=UPI003D094154